MNNDMIHIGMRPMLRIPEYKGTCYHCQQPVRYTNFIVLPLWRSAEDNLVVVPIELLACPHCQMPISTMQITGMHIGNTVLKEGPAKLN